MRYDKRSQWTLLMTWRTLLASRSRLKVMQNLHHLRRVVSNSVGLSQVSSKRRRSRGLEQSPWV